MTRFEKAKQGEKEMSVAIAFCIASALEQYNGFSFDDNELKEFIEDHRQEIEKWLRQETVVN